MTAPLFPPRPYLRLVPPPPRPRRIEVRFHVIDGRAAYGRSRIFHIAESDIDELIAVVTRMERRA